jgi:hypothetical protein
MKFLLFILGFNSDFTLRFCLYYGGKSLGGGDKTSSATTNASTTTVSTTNQQVGASEGSFAIGGQGNTVTLESLDPKLVEAAGGLIQNALKDSLGFAEQNQKQVNDLIKTTNTDFTNNLVKNQGIADSTLSNNIAKYVTIGGSIALVVLGLFIYKKSAKK